jgi:type VI secretion system secreted protein VgrG
MSPTKSDQLDGAGKDVSAQPQPSTVQGCPSKHWIEIVLVDEAGDPVPGQAYKVVAPDGTEYSGPLDGNGFVRIDNLQPGTCKVSFPDIEQIAPVRR